MRPINVVWVALFNLVIVAGAQPGMATTEYVDERPVVLTTLVVEGALIALNTVAWTRDGNEAAGISAIFLGTLQFAVGLGIAATSEASDYKAALITVGALGVITGLGSARRADQTDMLREQSRLDLSPTFDVSDREVGLQLTTRW